MQEIWKDIKGYENRYMISNYGNVKSIFFYAKNKSNKRLREYIFREKIIYVSHDSNGYPTVTLRNGKMKANKLIHRLVAESFLPKKENCDIVNHIDGNKKNNNINNLEWCDKRYNMIHAINVLGVKRDGEANPNSKYTDSQRQELINLYKDGKSVYYCSKNLNVNMTSAYKIINKYKKNAISANK